MPSPHGLQYVPSAAVVGGDGERDFGVVRRHGFNVFNQGIQAGVKRGQVTNDFEPHASLVHVADFFLQINQKKPIKPVTSSRRFQFSVLKANKVNHFTSRWAQASTRAAHALGTSGVIHALGKPRWRAQRRLPSIITAMC